MPFNILITGATGFIGGTVLKTLLEARKDKSAVSYEMIAAVRTPEQEQGIQAKLGVKTARFDLSDGPAAIEAIIENKIHLVIFCSNSMDVSLSKPLISGLRRRMTETGEACYFIHTSGASAFADKSGWTHGPVRDDDDTLFPLVSELKDSWPIRAVDTELVREAEEAKVPIFVVVPGLVYGKGTGEFNRQSIQIPNYIKSSIETKTVYKWDEQKEWPAVHVTDLAQFYLGLIVSIISGKAPPSGADGFLFPASHQVVWSALYDRLAVLLHHRGLVSGPTAEIWPSDEFTSKSLFGIPPSHVHTGWNSTSITIPTKSHLLGGGEGWQPLWGEAEFFSRLDDEVQAVLELGASTKVIQSTNKN